ncbi:MAG: glycosyltransferase [Armatimonadetes bacterium]|nr:glycosyltransferase [Armatimonadota bacterium]MDW8029737.1 glycosyltransferase family 2 protein [Armatimonadota bacterium]
MNEPNISVIIVNWNTREHLRQCLRSLLGIGDWGSGTGETDFEVIVVDNASVDGSAEMVQSEFPQVKLIANGCNVGYAAANNQAANLAKGRYFLLLNPDTELKPETIDKLVVFAELHTDAGAVAPKLVYPDGRLQPSIRSFPTPAALLFSALAFDKIFTTRHSPFATYRSPFAAFFGRYRMTWLSYDEVSEVDQPMASALLVRREAWEQVGGMDEAMPIFFNDVDFCWRLKKLGWRIYFLPEAIVVHHHGASTRLLGIGKALATHKGLLQFYDKHIRPLLPASLYWLLRTFIAFGSLLRIATLLAANFFHGGNKKR